ncbi:MAG: helix-turn-helix domain-containing protein [Deltaproteobacteria bacterium]|nr:helix-turn-helix domain-containing protein [Deltaproteobacteria bacterium]
MESLESALPEHKSLLKQIYETSQATQLGSRKKRFLSVQETAQYLGISPQTVCNKISCATEHQLPLKPKRIGRRVLFDIDDLNKYLESL